MAFQDFFVEIMSKKYPADFLRIRPWGSRGDQKNDGYLKSKRTLFQVYAPNELSEALTIKKIDEDFNGALPHWKEHFDIWVFVHNSRNGLGPEQTKKLLELANKNKDIKVISWSFDEIHNELFSLADNDVSALLGPPLTQKAMLDLRSNDLVSVLDSLSKIKPPVNIPIRPVRGDKIAKNNLSANVATLLRAGEETAAKVEWFFDNHPDKTIGDTIAESFRAEYFRLKAENLLPDQIFTGLHTFAGSCNRGQASHEAAVLAVLAFFFAECDIFEEP